MKCPMKTLGAMTLCKGYGCTPVSPECIDWVDGDCLSKEMNQEVVRLEMTWHVFHEQTVLEFIHDAMRNRQ